MLFNELIGRWLGANVHQELAKIQQTSTVYEYQSCYQDWRISHVILSYLQNIPFDSLWEVRKINRSVNFCIYSVAR
jgi:hypothetical protein